MPIFLATDIEESSRLWEKYQHQMRGLIGKHNSLLAELIHQNGGRIYRHSGDGVFAIFDTKEVPMQCALRIQKEISSLDARFHVRIVLHASSTAPYISPHSENFNWQPEEYLGTTDFLLNGLLNLAWGGQIIFTASAHEKCAIPHEAQILSLGKYQLSPFTSSLEVFQLTHPSLKQTSFPPLRNTAQKQNLPSYKTPFKGRTEELATLNALLSNRARLINLTGTGGIGKTRLAVQAGNQSDPLFQDGIYFTSFENHSHDDPFLTIVQSLGIPTQDETLPETLLINFLKTKAHALFILDAWDHLSNQQDLILTLLEKTSVTLLITSLQAIPKIPSHVLQIHGLSVVSKHAVESSQTNNCPAVQLFVWVAQRNNPFFHPTPEDFSAIAQICEWVDGSPLAIQFAASWTTIMTCEEIFQSITQDIHFLATNEQGYPKRHRSITALFNHSWQFLTPEEKLALQKCSIFTGTFSSDEALQIAGISPALLNTLAAKSFLQNSEERFKISALLRTFICTQFPLSENEHAQLLRIYCHYFIEFTVQRRNWLKGRFQKIALLDINTSFPDIQNVWQVVLENPQDYSLNSMAECLHLFFVSKSLYQEGRDFFRNSLTILNINSAIQPENSALNAQLMAHQIYFSSLLGEKPLDSITAQILSDLEDKGTANQWALGLIYFGIAYWRCNQLEQSKNLLLLSLPVCRKEHDYWKLGTVLNILGNINYDEGNIQQAYNLYQQALAVRQTIHDQIGEATSLNNIGYLFCEQEQLMKAKDLFSRALEINQSLGDRAGTALALINLAQVYSQQGHYEKAIPLQQKCLTIWQSVGDRNGIAFSLHVIGISQYQLGNLDAGEKLLIQSQDIFQDLAMDAQVRHCWSHLGVIAWLRNDLRLAAWRLQKGWSEDEDNQDHWGNIFAWVHYSSVLRDQEHHEKAVYYLTQAILKFQEIGLADRSLHQEIALNAATLLLLDGYENIAYPMITLLHKAGQRTHNIRLQTQPWIQAFQNKPALHAQLVPYQTYFGERNSVPVTISTHHLKLDGALTKNNTIKAMLDLFVRTYAKVAAG